MASAAQTLRLARGAATTAPAMAKANASSSMLFWRETGRASSRAARALSTTAVRGEEAASGSARERKLEPWELEMLRKTAAGDRIHNISQALVATLTAAERERLPANTVPLSAGEEIKAVSDVRRGFVLERPNRRVLRSFWNTGESDPEMISSEDDDFMGNDITSMAHGKLDETRERRHYARVMAWEMPLLSKLAKPFEPPTADMPLRFRFTSYLGELHPAERKVVVEFCPADLGLTPVQERKLQKLAGTRFHPATQIVRISCEQFEHQAQNKRYLGDLVQTLLAEARDPTDTFEDVPLDTRHHVARAKPSFPRAWRMTDARRQELQALRAAAFQRDQARAAAGTIVDGVLRARQALAPKPPPAAPGVPAPPLADRVAETVLLRR